MLLFFRLLFIIFLIIIIISLILVLSELKIIFSTLEFHMDGIDKHVKYSGKIGIYFLGKIKLFSKKIDSQKTSKFLRNNRIQEKIARMKQHYIGNNTVQNKIKIEILKELKKNLKIDVLKLQILIDTESAVLTSYLVAIISALIPNVIRHNIKSFNSEKYKWSIKSIYKNKNYIGLQLNSIISIKVVHIINMFKLIGGIKDERSSNRRLNVNCYGEH